MNNMIVFDCERMKYPNTGLYFFCDMLAESLSKEAQSHKEKLAFYVPRNLKGNWGTAHQYKVVHKFHKLFIPCSKNIKVWHTTFQLSSYIPTGKKLILTVHDLNFLYEKKESKQGKCLRKMQRIVNKADYIVTISEATRKDLLEHIDIKGKPIEVIYNGRNIYTGDYVQPAEVPQRPFLFTVGTVLPKKNFHVLPCLLQGNDYELIIAGVRSDYEDRIMQEATRLGVRDRVKIIGTIPEDEKHWYLLHCKAFLFPYIAEGFGLPVIEAMYYQKPIFLSDHTCLPKIGGEYAYYFNSEFDEEQMQAEFKQGMEDFENGGINKKKMREHALRFSWSTAAKRYWEIYQKLINE